MVWKYKKRSIIWENCVYCGGDIERKRSNKMYCSPSCRCNAYLLRKEKKNANSPKMPGSIELAGSADSSS